MKDLPSAGIQMENPWNGLVFRIFRKTSLYRNVGKCPSSPLRLETNPIDCAVLLSNSRDIEA